MAQEMKVTGCMCSTKPDYSTAWTLLDEIHEFYADPENEKAFREWEKEYDARKKGA